MPRESSPDPKRTPGRYAFDGLQRVIHEKARLSIVSSLAANPEGLTFTELRTLCSLTDGNLSRQIQLLESSGLVEVWKRFHNKRPQTLCRLTKTGREQFLEYVAELERVVATAQHAAEKGAASKDPRHDPPALGRVIPSI